MVILVVPLSVRAVKPRPLGRRYKAQAQSASIWCFLLFDILAYNRYGSPAAACGKIAW
jgi:hypothetical protein